MPPKRPKGSSRPLSPVEQAINVLTDLGWNAEACGSKRELFGFANVAACMEGHMGLLLLKATKYNTLNQGLSQAYDCSDTIETLLMCQNKVEAWGMRNGIVSGAQSFNLEATHVDATGAPAFVDLVTVLGSEVLPAELNASIVEKA